MSFTRPSFITRLVDRRTKRRVVDSYLGPQQAAAREWTRSVGAPDNFYYGLTARNTEHLISLFAVVFSQPQERVREIAEELPVADSIQAAAHSLNINPVRLYGRRLGWYLVARLVHPTLVVETGVHDGIGAVILSEALRRNSLEGNSGCYRGTDIDPEAGWLLKTSDVDAKVLYGDSITSLESFSPKSVGLFINDSDHSSDYEYREYQTIASRLSDNGVILGDNAHATDSLLRYSRESGRHFIFFDERPLDHWYPGAGIGISLKRPEMD